MNTLQDLTMTSQLSATPDSIAVAAHQAYLASQSSQVHPVLQQIQNMNNQYGMLIGNRHKPHLVIPFPRTDAF